MERKKLKIVNDQLTIPGRAWWKEAVVYQIYPRSFKDSNSDGIGDLKGIIDKLDYIKNLGIDIVWLNPIYASPNADNGYDISDYEAIMEEFGTMEEFDALLAGLRERDIKLMMDLVVNHSSDQHKWFIQSRSSRDNPFRDYYHWWPAEKGKPPFRKSFFDVDENAWQFDEKTQAYYLHYFSYKQPDLNWENPVLREEVYQMMRFWLNKGVDGFRMDVISFISKDLSWPIITQVEIDKKYNGDWSEYYAKGPHLHEYLHEMYEKVLKHYETVTVAEGTGVIAADAYKFVDPQREELNMLYHFDGVSLGYLPHEFKQPDPNGYSLVEFKEIYSLWDKAFSNGWGTIYLGNHDQPRMLSRWGNDSPQWRALSSKMLTTFLMTMRATPYYYAGDELGMANIKLDDIADYRDIETLNKYQQFKGNKEQLHRFMEAQKITARDNGRTPFQWNDSENAGFTNDIPWIKVNADYKMVNAATEEDDPDSVLSYFRKIVLLRKNSAGLIYGVYELLDKDNPKIYTYTRTLNDQKLLVLLNFSAEEATADVPFSINNSHCLINNYPLEKINKDTLLKLRPYEAAVYEIGS